jgi:hypothetical protein
MFKAKPPKNEQLDRAGRRVLKAAAAPEDEVRAAESSPFLFTRIRAAIAEEQRRREETSSWLSLVFVARRAIPAMALIAILAAVLTIWSTQFAGSSSQWPLDDEALGASEPGVEQSVLASSNGLSRDDVFNIVVDRNYEANGK